MLRKINIFYYNRRIILTQNIFLDSYHLIKTAHRFPTIFRWDL